MSKSKKISPQAILALKDALSVIYWKKDELKFFIKSAMDNPSIIGTINWDGTKRESVNELMERMTNRLDIYQQDLMNLLLAVTDLTDFSHLDFWDDDDGTKKKEAEEEVNRLRNHTKGYIQISQEQEKARKRKKESESNIAKNIYLESELNILKKQFLQISSNENFQKRGFELEKFLNRLFNLYELNPRDSFKNFGEQIDGAFTFDGTDYLMEAKWSKQVNRSDLASFQFKVEGKLKIAMGLLVTIDGVTPEAISPDFNSLIIMDGSDIMAIIDNRVRLTDLLYKKRRKANETGKIYIPFNEL